MKLRNVSLVSLLIGLLTWGGLHSFNPPQAVAGYPEAIVNPFDTDTSPDYTNSGATR